VVLSRGNVISTDHLPFGDAREARNRARLSARKQQLDEEEMADPFGITDEEVMNAESSPGGGARSNGRLSGDGGSLKRAVADLEKRLILEALERAGGNRSKAAEELGIYRRLLYSKLREFGLGE
ncbi:MAG: hypothetical protein M3Y88_08260, partial [Chloroflexota bacterium]|nr:hypothetical protein [Chloroflexota bacterium]